MNLKSLEVGGASAGNIPRSSTAISLTSGTDLKKWKGRNVIILYRLCYFAAAARVACQLLRFTHFYLLGFTGNELGKNYLLTSCNFKWLEHQFLAQQSFKKWFCHVRECKSQKDQSFPNSVSGLVHISNRRELKWGGRLGEGGEGRQRGAKIEVFLPREGEPSSAMIPS